MNKVLFSSLSIEWGSPQYIFDFYDLIYHFDVDVCASSDNAKVEHFFDISSDGLSQSWDGLTCWCNPPYGRQISAWVKKAALSRSLVVMLLPARVDTKWFHDFVLPFASRIEFIRGRLRFGNSKKDAPFPSMVVIFDNLDVKNA